MTEPLALLYFERLIPGTQLPPRLEKLGYRVQIVEKISDLYPTAVTAKPLVIIADLANKDKNVCPAISQIRQDSQTQHIPIIAIGDSSDPRLELTAKEAGATLVVSEAAISMHLKELLDQALFIE